MMKAVIFLNGEYDYEKEFIRNMINDEDMVFCADGGANYTYDYDIVPDYIIGDLDSVTEDALNFYKKNNVNIEKYSPEKDFTDFELILHKIEKYRKEKNIVPDNIYVFGGLGKRIDMTLNNLHLMERYKNITFFSKDEEIFFKESSFSLEDKKNRSISIIPLDRIIEKLTLEGFKYEIENMDVERKSSRLVSNVITSGRSFINFKKGKIIVILRKNS